MFLHRYVAIIDLCLDLDNTFWSASGYRNVTEGLEKFLKRTEITDKPYFN